MTIISFLTGLFINSTAHIISTFLHIFRIILKIRIMSICLNLKYYQGPTGLNSVILKANASKSPVKFEMTYTKF